MNQLVLGGLLTAGGIVLGFVLNLIRDKLRWRRERTGKLFDERLEAYLDMLVVEYRLIELADVKRKQAPKQDSLRKQLIAASNPDELAEIAEQSKLLSAELEDVKGRFDEAHTNLARVGNRMILIGHDRTQEACRRWQDAVRKYSDSNNQQPDSAEMNRCNAEFVLAVRIELGIESRFSLLRAFARRSLQHLTRRDRKSL